MAPRSHCGLDAVRRKLRESSTDFRQSFLITSSTPLIYYFSFHLLSGIDRSCCRRRRRRARRWHRKVDRCAAAEIGELLSLRVCSAVFFYFPSFICQSLTSFRPIFHQNRQMPLRSWRLQRAHGFWFVLVEEFLNSPLVLTTATSSI